MLLNNKPFQFAEVTFRAAVKFEKDYGLSLFNIGDNILSFIQAYVAYSSGLTEDQAGREIEYHIAHGGSFQELTEEAMATLKGSGFFSQMSRNQAASTQPAHQTEAPQIQPQVQVVPQIQPMAQNQETVVAYQQQLPANTVQ